MKNILSLKISSNMLKTIALVAMVIDHIGFYFSPYIPTSIYSVCRIIGRIAMPIFTYLLVQGFFYTKNFNKYLLRIAGFAGVMQLVIVILMILNRVYVPGYTAANQIYMTGNILFSFVIVLVVLKLIHEKILVKKWDYNKNMSLKIVTIILILLTCIIIPLDYGIEVVIFAILIYFIERFKIQLQITKSAHNVGMKNIFVSAISDDKINMMYLVLVFMALSLVTMAFNKSLFTLLAIIPIMLYNGNKGKRKLKYMYYFAFILQHALLYSLAMLITLT